MSSYDYIEQSPGSGGDEDAVMRDLARIIFAQIWWVIGIAACVIVGAVIYSKLSTPIYSADALIQLDSDNSMGSNAASQALSGLTQAAGAHTDAEIEIMKSRVVVEPVVEQFKLNFGAWPNTMPYLGRLTQLFAHAGHPLPPLFGMHTYAWGGEQFAVDSITVPQYLEGTQLTLRALGDGHFELVDPTGTKLLSGKAGTRAEGHGVSILVDTLVARPGTEFYVMRYNQLDAVMGLAGGLQVLEKGHDTGVVQLSFMGPNPGAITAIVNAIAASYLKHRQERAQEEASRMLSFLNSEMPRVREDLRRTETALSEYQARSGSFQPTQEAGVYLNGSLEFQRQIAELQLARTQMLARFTEESPEIHSIDAQIAALAKQRDRFEKQFKTLPGDEREAVSLQRDAKVAEDIYVALLNKVQELSITRAGTVGNAHIIDDALVPLWPVQPKPGLIVSAGVMLGLLAGVGFAFCRQKLFTGVADPEFIERHFQMPIFGSISFSREQAQSDRLAANAAALSLPSPKHHRSAALPVPVGTQTIELPASQPTRPLLVQTHPFDVSVEGLRGLRTSLQFGLVDAPNRVVAFTSPAPGDGKSFLCANLAVLLAETGKRVLLIDADLRRGRLAQYLGHSPNGGLTELLTGQVDLDIAARVTGVQGLHFIAAGAYPPNPSEILTSRRFAEIIARFEQQFDLVLIDTPPLLAVADAAIIANVAGSTVMVMRAGAHTESNISEALKKLRRARARLIGGVLNAVPQKGHGRYGTYDYAYAYTYTAGSLEDDEKKKH